MSVHRFYAVKKLRAIVEMELANAMFYKCEKQLVNGDVKKASAICKEAVHEAIAEDY